MSNTCPNPISVLLSRDGLNLSTQINLLTTGARYYFHTNAGCSTNLEVQYRFCPLDDPQCSSPWNEVAPWGEYRTDALGLARIDYDATIPVGYHFARFRPLGSEYEWSNIVRVRMEEEAEPALTDIEAYIIQVPGYVYVYETINRHSGDEVNQTRIQIEEERDWCQYRVRPWRITKDDHDAYWAPFMAESQYASQHDLNLRWMVASPTTPVPQSASVPANFNDFLWVVGDRRYNRPGGRLGLFRARALPNPGLRDLGEQYARTSYGIAAGDVPAVKLAPKQARIPYYFSGTSSYLTATTDNQSVFCPSPGVNAGTTPNYHWRLRIERDTVTIGQTTYEDVLRCDYFEEPVDTASNRLGLLRESWYFAKGVGLVKVLASYFDNFDGMGAAAPPCSDNADCLNDTIKRPYQEIILLRHYANPVLSVVARAGEDTTFGTTICVNQAGPQPWYHFQLANTDFSGYLEIVENDPAEGVPTRWNWVEKGRVVVDVSDRAPGTYTCFFRIWVPDDLDSEETNLQDHFIEWSNPLTITIQTTSCP